MSEMKEILAQVHEMLDERPASDELPYRIADLATMYHTRGYDKGLRTGRNRAEEEMKRERLVYLETRRFRDQVLWLTSDMSGHSCPMLESEVLGFLKYSLDLLYGVAAERREAFPPIEKDGTYIFLVEDGKIVKDEHHSSDVWDWGDRDE